MPEFSNAVVGIAKTLVYKRAAVEQVRGQYCHCHLVEVSRSIFIT